MKADSEKQREVLKATMSLSSEAMAAVDERAWAAWDSAWDAARDEDRRAGRRYERERYMDAAGAAREQVFRDAVAAAIAKAEGRE